MNHIGIDGCKAGWFYVSFDKALSWAVGILNTIDMLDKIVAPDDMILIDIPIGLREQEQHERLCDKEARKLLKNRGPSIFPAPSRLSLGIDDYKTASKTNFINTGRRLSRQTYAISPKIKEVDDFVRRDDIRHNIREFHPEFCFLALNAFIPLDFKKKSKEGIQERLKILTNHLAIAPEILKAATSRYLRKQVAVDDIVDALSGAVAASLGGRLKTVPEFPEKDKHGLAMEIVYPDLSC